MSWLEWTLWFKQNPVLGLLWLVVVIEVLAVVPQLLWLVAATARYARRQEALVAFSQDVMVDLAEAMDTAEGRAAWIERAKQGDPSVVRELLLPYLIATTGDYQRKLREVYKALGFLKGDRDGLTAIRWGTRLKALRRVSVMADPSDRLSLLHLLDDRWSIKLLAAQTLARVGRGDDIMTFLSGWDSERRMHEHPLRVILRTMSSDAFTHVASHWDEIEASIPKRLVLMMAAERAPKQAERWLLDAMGHADKEVRIGACIAAAHLPGVDSFWHLNHRLEDDAWEVRAHAARNLGALADPDAVPALGKAMRDSSFWVRQNAAVALYSFGALGRGVLIDLVEHGKDAFAQDSARQELARQRGVLGQRATGGRRA